MLHILLIILKILGIVLAVILGLILLILLLVLFVPFRYRGRLSGSGSTDSLEGRITLSYLLHLVHGGLYYENGILSLLVRVLGIPVFRRTLFDPADKDDSGDSAESDEEESDEAVIKESDEADIKVSDEADIKVSDEADKEESAQTDIGNGTNSAISSETADMRSEEKASEEKASEVKASEEKASEEKAPEEKASEEKASEEKTSEEKTPKEKPSEEEASVNKKKKKHKGTSKESLVQKLKNIYNKITDEHTQKVLKLLKKQIHRLFKAILPRKIRGECRFGFDDPSYTGYVLALAGAFYGKIARRLKLTPVFTEQVFEGNLRFSGHIRMAHILLIALQIWFNRDFKYVKRMLFDTDN